MGTVLRTKIPPSEGCCRASKCCVDSPGAVSRRHGHSPLKRVGRWPYVLALLLLFGVPAGAAAQGRAYFFLSSDQVRALRNVALADVNYFFRTRQ